jgi:hypothetical protein
MALNLATEAELNELRHTLAAHVDDPGTVVFVGRAHVHRPQLEPGPTREGGALPVR